MEIRNDLIQRPFHIEVVFGNFIRFPGENPGKTGNGIDYGNKLSLAAGKGFGYEHGLSEEALNLSGPGNDELVLIGKFIHTQDGDDILQILVALKNFLYSLGDP